MNVCNVTGRIDYRMNRVFMLSGSRADVPWRLISSPTLELIFTGKEVVDGDV